jgi:hypothetical protein
VKDTRQRVLGIDAELFPNTASAYGLADIRSLNALYPERYVSYIKTFIQPDFVDRYIGGPPFGEARRGETDNNPMFDLTGVRYIVAAGQEPGDLIVRDYFVANPPNDRVQLSKILVGSDLRTAILIRPTGQATLAVPAGATKLALALARDPADAGPGDGPSLVEVFSGRTGGTPLAAVPVLAGDPAWKDIAVDLPPGTTEVTLSTAATSSGRGAVGFATLRYAFSDKVPGQQYLHVSSSDGAEVYENRHSLPRALVVPEVVPVGNEKDALEYFRSVSAALPSGALRVRTFDPAQTAVVERLPESRARQLGGCAPGHAQIKAYSHLKVVVDVEAGCPGLLVLTDTYYPGWKARVNGQASRIYAADIAFRGVTVPGGRSTVEFRYSPGTFALGVKLAVAGMLGAMTAVVLSRLARSRKSRVPV